MSGSTAADDVRRIVVLGSSMPLGLGPAEVGGLGLGPPYPVLLERRLRACGHRARVECRSRAGSLLGDALDRFEEDLLQPAPDVVLLHFGTCEAFSGAVPQALRRLAYPDFPRQSIAARAFRRLAGRRLRRAVVAVQRRHAARLGPARSGRRSPDRFGRELGLLLDTAQRLAGDPHVVVLPATPFGDRVESAMPGSNERIAALADHLAAVVGGRGPRVHLLDVPAALASVDWLSVDGIHLTDRGHVAVADALAELLDPLLGG